MEWHPRTTTTTIQPVHTSRSPVLIMPNPIKTEQRERILALITKKGPMTIREVAEKIGATTRSTQASIMALVADGFLKGEGIRPAVYSKTTSSGNTDTRLTLKDRPVFKGVDWSISTMRPGCLDHLKHPSRRSDGFHTYREPLLNASSVYTVKEHA
jgi:hypothetical protein